MFGTELAVGALIAGALAAGLVVGFLLGVLFMAMFRGGSMADDVMERD